MIFCYLKNILAYIHLLLSYTFKVELKSIHPIVISCKRLKKILFPGYQQFVAEPTILFLLFYLFTYLVMLYNTLLLSCGVLP